MTTIAEPTHEPGVAPDDELEHEAEANDATPPSPPADGKQLFDASDYDREDLALPKIDGNQIDQISVKFSGEVFLDRSDPADVALYRKLQLGHDVTLHIEGRCSSTGAKGATNREGDLDVVVGQRSVKVTTVYVPAIAGDDA